MREMVTRHEIRQAPAEVMVAGYGMVCRGIEKRGDWSRKFRIWLRKRWIEPMRRRTPLQGGRLWERKGGQLWDKPVRAADEARGRGGRMWDCQTTSRIFGKTF
jgi:hypothetical protein